MKILAIRGKNLASLEGEFEIDFTAEPLKSAGIFAITGSTGSGKSTLLDALCLALFDDTPRNNRTSESLQIIDVKDKTINQKDSRNILRRGTSDGYAEVDFVSLGGETFRSRWSVRRSRDKIDGSLQNSEFRLANLTTDIEVQGRKTELLAKVVKLIGLTFDQFTRAVLLAQGDFATFLKATQKEKAELLEKLTGTDIYSRISSSIYDNSKSAEQELNLLKERIKDIELLSDEELEAITAEKQLLLKELESLKIEVSQLTTKIKWLADEELLNKGVKQAEQLLADSQKAIEQAKPRYDYLVQIDRVQEIRDSYNELKQSQKQLADNRSNLAKQKSERDANALLLKQATEQVMDCEKEQSQHTEAIAQIEPHIKKARELDVRLVGAKANAQEAKTEYNNCVKTKEQNALIINDKELLLRAQIETITQLEQQQIDLQSIIPTEVIALREKLEQGKPCSVCGSISHPFREIVSETKQLEIKEIARLWKENIEKHNTVKQSIATSKGELSIDKLNLASISKNLIDKEQKQKSCLDELEKLQGERSKVIDGKSADEVEKQYTDKSKEIDNRLKKLTASKGEIATKSETFAGVITQILGDIAKQSKHCEELQKQVNTWLAAQGEITSDQLAELLLKDSNWLTTERAALNGLRENKTSVQATLAERQKNAEEHTKAEIKPADGEEQASLQTVLEERNSYVEQKSKQNAEIDLSLANHEKGKAKIKMFEKELNEKNVLSENWKKLNEMFGSADGSKFKVLAQGYTLEALLTYANKHLQELSKRYELQRIPDKLGLQVVDLDMLGEVRTVHSLSGGESFLVSLALALGLSSLSSNRMKVESLFIDEGFGSLDMDTLRVAMDALEHLQTQGRKIGVISHVVEMTERITALVRVVKTSNGRSRIEVSGS